MPTPRLSWDLAYQVVAVTSQCLDEGYVLDGQPSAKEEAARRLKMDHGTYKNRLRKAYYYYKLKPKKPPAAEPEMPEGEPPPQDEPLASKERQRLEDQIARLRSELRDANRVMNEEEDIRQRFFDLAQQQVEPPAWSVGSHHAGAPGIPVLFTSDFQWGEVIRAEDVDHLNEFNLEIGRKRYRRLIDKTVDLAFNHTVNPDFPGLIYLRGGDAISGSIHEELAQTDEKAPIGQVVDLAAEETRGIELLAERFGRVRVVTIPGNHGRTTKKPQSKRYTDHNFETALAYILEREFKGDDRVSFWTPESGDAYFPIYNTRFLLTHGDRIGTRGGTGFIGPVATIARGVHKVREQYAKIGKPIDWVLMGHFHVAMMLEDSIVNGSLPGFSEFARGLRFKPTAPLQWLFFVHPRYGITTSWRVYLDDHPDVGDRTPTPEEGWWAEG